MPVEQKYRGEAVNLARNTLEDATACKVTIKGVVLLCQAVMEMDTKLRADKKRKVMTTKLMPKEPSKEMIEAMQFEIARGMCGRSVYKALYVAATAPDHSELIQELVAAAREIPGIAIKAGTKLYPPRLVAALNALDAAIDGAKEPKP